jgi:hypothetical protein
MFGADTQSIIATVTYLKNIKHEDDDEYEYEEENCIASYSCSSSSSITAFLR